MTLSTDPGLLWYMDSAVPLHCIFDLHDIIDPVLLPEPLPIGSADGSIIYDILSPVTIDSCQLHPGVERLSSSVLGL